MNYSRKIDKALGKAISQITTNKEEYVKNPKTDFTRNRKLNIKDLILLTLSLRRGTLKTEIHAYYKTKKTDLTSSAFIQQRAKLSSNAFRDIFNGFNARCKDSKTYRGYRVLAVDGTDINCPRNPEAESFLNNSQYPAGYNLMHLNALYDVTNKTYVDVLPQPRKQSDEQGTLVTMLRRNVFSGKNIITADRGYESYNVIATFLNTKNLDFVIRLRHGNGAMYDVQKLPMAELDVDVEIPITTTQTNDDKKHGRHFIQTGSKKGKINSSKTNISRWDFPSPYVIKMRIVRFMLDTGEYETLATSLPRGKFSIEDIKEIYHMRWDIETSFRDLKHTFGLAYLHSKKDESILQEIYAAVTMYNYCSRIAGSVEIQQRPEYMHEHKVNFKRAADLCAEYALSMHKDDVSLIKNIRKDTSVVRPGRHFNRNIRIVRFVGFAYRG